MPATCGVRSIGWSEALVYRRSILRCRPCAYHTRRRTTFDRDFDLRRFGDVAAIDLCIDRNIVVGVINANSIAAAIRIANGERAAVSRGNV
jgi:hypothetical protein